MKTILVTGGSGFIGSNFVLKAREEGWFNIINLDKLTYASNPKTLAQLETDEGYYFVRGDIGDVTHVEEILSKFKPAAIVNFAAESHVDRSILDPGVFIQANVVGTLNLLNVSHSYWEQLESSEKQQFRFLHVSTDEVYGSLNADDPAFCESTPYAPNSPYAASKASSDHLVRAYHHTYGLPTLTTNCSNNYGPRQFPEKLIPLVILNALEAKPLPIYGDGQNIRDWLYVEDHCTAIYQVLKNGAIGDTYNVGGNSEKNNLEVVQNICQILDELVPNQDFKHESLITFVKDRLGHDRRYAINSSKIKKEIGWQPQETFESGLYKTVQWYLDNPTWVQEVRSGEYQRWIVENYISRNS